MNRQLVTVGVAVAVLVIAGIAYTVFRTGTIVPDSGTQPITGPERAEAARGLIEEIEEVAEPGETDYDKAFAEAQAFQRAGQLADAQLLYFFGARAGHAASAFELAAMNDPNHHSPASSLLPEPDAFQAYRWYSVAREQGMAAAAERLDALREWADAAAGAGNEEAERLLLQWE